MVRYLIETRNCVEIELCTIFVQVYLACRLPRPVTSAAHIDLTLHIDPTLLLFLAGPVPSSERHLSYGDCLEVKSEYYQNCSVMDCVTQCSQSAAHLYEQFLQVQQIGFVTSEPLRHAQRRLSRVVLL